jgi:ADP-ribose pyrophosphatase
MKHKNWKILSCKTVYEQNPWLRVVADKIELPDGRLVEDYLRLEAPDFVMIVPVNKFGQIGLIRSYKHGIIGIDIQPPAGYMEAEENALDAAKRELLEETGCETQDWQSLGTYTISGNRGAGSAHFFLAKNCDQIKDPDPGDLEIQEVFWMGVQEVKKMLLSGQFLQLSSVAILGLALSTLEEQYEIDGCD